MGGTEKYLAHGKTVRCSPFDERDKTNYGYALRVYKDKILNSFAEFSLLSHQKNGAYLSNIQGSSVFLWV
jgi:hypothetical protein